MASDPREAYQRLLNELQHRARTGGGGGIPNMPKGFFAGGGLIAALVVGGIALNSALFNGNYT